MTIAQALDVSQRSISFREAEIFLQDILSVSRSALHTHPESELTPVQEKTYQCYISRREANEPVGYIIGHKEFYGRPFKTDKRALIPRPETEALIERTLQILKNQQGSRILEIGTGSGNIAVTLSLELPDADITATDISAEALELAGENQRALSPPRPIRLLEADMFNHPEISGPYDLIVANLPYVPDAWRFDQTAQPEVVFQEPDIALFGGVDGLDHYRVFFAGVQRYLKPGGTILIEYGEDETGDIVDFVHMVLPEATLTVHKDYAGLDRVLELHLTS